VNFSLAFEPARDIILDFSQKYELDQNRAHLLLSELESAQRKHKFVLTEKDLRDISLRSRARRITVFGNGNLLILATAIKFVNEDSQLVNLMMLSKETYKLLEMRIYKQALLRSQPERLHLKRKKIWTNIFKIVLFFFIFCY